MNKKQLVAKITPKNKQTKLLSKKIFIFDKNLFFKYFITMTLFYCP